MVAILVPFWPDFQPGNLFATHQLEALVAVGLELFGVDHVLICDLSPLIEVHKLAIVVAKLVLVVDRVARLWK